MIKRMRSLPTWHFWDGSSKGDPPGSFRWSGKKPPPKIFEEIDVDANNFGRCTVVDYFVDEPWLGIVLRIHNPPGWLLMQTNGRSESHLFGAEIEYVKKEKTTT